LAETVVVDDDDDDDDGPKAQTERDAQECSLMDVLSLDDDDDDGMEFFDSFEYILETDECADNSNKETWSSHCDFDLHAFCLNPTLSLFTPT